MTLIVRFPDSLHAERAYSAHVVMEIHLGLECQVVFENRADVEIHMSGDRGKILRVADGVFSSGDSGWPATAVRPVVSNDYAPSAGDVYPHDVFGTTFWYLTRLEEVLSTERDEHQRFPVSAGRDCDQTPCVDELIDRFGARLLHSWPQLELRKWSFEFVPTHDVDRPFKHLFQSDGRLLRGMARDVLRRRNIGAALRAPWVRSRVMRGSVYADPFNTFEWLMDQSERAGVRSTFYFLCTPGSGGVDGDYRIQHPEMRRVLRRIHDRGHLIGLHGSYGSAFDERLLAGEVQTLRETCGSEGIRLERILARQHVLRFDPRLTPQRWAGAQIDEDSTLGHAGRAGFRCGTCRAFPIFDTVGRSTTRIIEKPLITMDATLLEERYEHLAAGDALARIEALGRRCREVGGSFVFLWHNCRLEDASSRSLYQSAIRLLT